MNLIFFLFVIIPSAIIHEYSHAWAATQLGDPTPRRAGRLTINPLAHIDPFGTLFLPLILFLSGGHILFAYAKPVPFNPTLLKNQKYGPGLVALVGPLSNFLIAISLGLLIRFLPIGSFTIFLSIIVFANILLAIFNLIPIPPLDGSRILFSFLPTKWLRYEFILERYGFILILLLIFFASPLISSLVYRFTNLIVGSALYF